MDSKPPPQSGMRSASGRSVEDAASMIGSLVSIPGIHILYFLTGGEIPWGCRTCSGVKERLQRLETLPIEFRWGMTLSLPKTGALSDERFRSCCTDAVLEGSASTRRLAPNRALSLCTGQELDCFCLWAKFRPCSSNGLGVTACSLGGTFGCS